MGFLLIVGIIYEIVVAIYWRFANDDDVVVNGVDYELSVVSGV